MGTCDLIYCNKQTLMDQLAAEVFAFLPEDGLFVAFVDRQGNHWASNEKVFKSFVGQDGIGPDIFTRIDDGFDPVIERWDHGTFVAGQLCTESADYGYLFVFLPGYTPQTTLANIHIVDGLFNQVVLAARLIEQNEQLRHLRHQHLLRTAYHGRAL